MRSSTPTLPRSSVVHRTLSLWADTPTKVLKDVQTARAQAASTPTPTVKSDAKPDQGEKAAPGVLDSMKSLFASSPGSEQPATKPATPDKTVTTNASPAPSDKTEQVQTHQGRPRCPEKWRSGPAQQVRGPGHRL